MNAWARVINEDERASIGMPGSEAGLRPCHSPPPYMCAEGDVEIMVVTLKRYWTCLCALLDLPAQGEARIIMMVAIFEAKRTDRGDLRDVFA